MVSQCGKDRKRFFKLNRQKRSMIDKIQTKIDKIESRLNKRDC